MKSCDLVVIDVGLNFTFEGEWLGFGDQWCPNSWHVSWTSEKKMDDNWGYLHFREALICYYVGASHFGSGESPALGKATANQLLHVNEPNDL